LATVRRVLVHEITMKDEPRFACDAMLGGLARWLRAAGYDASWHASIADSDLILLSQAEGRTLLSSDSGIFLHTVIRDGLVPALFVPLRLDPQRQLAHVLGKLGLPVRQPRCMKCGGTLLEIPKEQAAGRVPLRTFTWLDHYWECSRCKKVYWHGTHWRRIEDQLRQLPQVDETIEPKPSAR
jgi:uncharacterized protein with PIN domain